MVSVTVRRCWGVVNQANVPKAVITRTQKILGVHVLATDVCGQVLGFSRPFKVAVFITGFKYKSTAASSAFSKTRKTLNGRLLCLNFLLLIPSFTP
jgi:hypothetical protein